jgi:hypothetical protein
MNDTATLPPLDDERIAGMERALFARIGEARARASRRRRIGLTAAGAAAALLVAVVVVTPLATQSVGSDTASTGYAVDQPVGDAPGQADTSSGAESAALPESTDAASAGGARTVVSTGAAALIVDDVPSAAEAIAADARARGGYVESVDVGVPSSTEAVPFDAGPDGAAAYPSPAADGWITVHVPADVLDATIAELAERGEVTSSSVSRVDVTDQAIDLRARIAAAETSVRRLTELLARSETTADLIAAESALQERQAALDADRQQLAALESQVDLASLSVQLATRSVAVDADPGGFGDGVRAGWNGLVAALNGFVIALGFLLPWLGVLAVAGTLVWAIVLLVRRLRAPQRRTRGR